MTSQTLSCRFGSVVRICRRAPDIEEQSNTLLPFHWTLGEDISSELHLGPTTKLIVSQTRFLFEVIFWNKRVGGFCPPPQLAFLLGMQSTFQSKPSAAEQVVRGLFLHLTALRRSMQTEAQEGGQGSCEVANLAAASLSPWLRQHWARVLNKLS